MVGEMSCTFQQLRDTEVHGEAEYGHNNSEHTQKHPILSYLADNPAYTYAAT